MAVQLDQRSVSRDTIQLKKKLDEVMYSLAEQVQGQKGGVDQVTLDAMVDGAVSEAIVPVAHYVRKILRRYDINADQLLGGE